MARKLPDSTEIARNMEVATLREEVRSLVTQNNHVLNQNHELVESLDQVQAMFSREDVNWRTAFITEYDWGLSLDDLKLWSEQIRNAMIGNPHIKRGKTLRTSYVWGNGGIRYDNIPGARQGRGTNVQALIGSTLNQRNFFGATARTKREGSLYADGLYLVIGNNDTKQLHSIPLREITADYRDPDFDTDIWAYRRSWLHYVPGTTDFELKHMWYFTDTHWDKRVPIVHYGGVEEQVSPNVAFDLIANPIDGHTFGSPDALAALIWSRIVRDLTMDGVKMSNALAQFAFQASMVTKNGQATAGMRLAEQGAAGQTVVTGAANSLAALPTAGKGYDFSSIRPVMAVMASALDVSVVALTSDSGTGDSNGSISALDLPTRLAMEARRDEHVAFDKRVLKWMGAPEPDVSFAPLEDAADLYRRMQAIGFRWETGLYGAQETRDEFDETLGRRVSAPVPDGVMLPNNEKFVNTLSNDDQSAGAGGEQPANPTLASGGPKTPQAGAPGQGKSNKVGKAPGKSNALRTDKVT